MLNSWCKLWCVHQCTGVAHWNTTRCPAPARPPANGISFDTLVYPSRFRARLNPNRIPIGEPSRFPIRVGRFNAAGGWEGSRRKDLTFSQREAITHQRRGPDAFGRTHFQDVEQIGQECQDVLPHRTAQINVPSLASTQQQPQQPQQSQQSLYNSFIELVTRGVRNSYFDL